MPKKARNIEPITEAERRLAWLLAGDFLRYGNKLKGRLPLVCQALIQTDKELDVLREKYRKSQDEVWMMKKGAELASALGLHRDKEYDDRWYTPWGTKTDIGFARTLLRMLLEDE